MLAIRHIIYITFMSLGTVHNCKTDRGNILSYLWVPKDLCSSKNSKHGIQGVHHHWRWKS